MASSHHWNSPTADVCGFVSSDSGVLGWLVYMPFFQRMGFILGKSFGMSIHHNELKNSQKMLDFLVDFAEPIRYIE